MKILHTCLVAFIMIATNAGILFAQEEVAKGQVVVYTALDKQFSQPILADFEKETGIKVKAVYDTEAVKTVGLVNRLLAERHRPRADVFWNNEILRSIQLKKEGLVAPYKSPSAESIPDVIKDPEGYWTGFAARTRVLLVNKDLLPDPATWPGKTQELTLERWKGKAAFAKPLFGTTNTHAAVIWAMSGEENAKSFWNKTFGNAIMEAGNAQARDAVVAGEVAWCITDTDDAHGAVEDGANVALVYPKDDPAGPGTLVIPNTLVLLKNSPNQENGKKLIDYLLSKKVEAKLAGSRSAQIPVRDDVPGPKNLPPLPEAQILDVDWEKAYQAIAPSTSWLDQKIKEQ